MKPIEQSEMGSRILKDLGTLAVDDLDAHRQVLSAIVAQAGRINESGYVSVVCLVLADTLKGAEIVSWLRRMQEQILAGRNGDVLETLSELEEWLSRLWQVADPLGDCSAPISTTTKSRRRKRMNVADLQFLKLIGVSAENK